MDGEQATGRKDEMVSIYAAPTFVEVELLEAAFRAHRLPHVIRYKVRYLEPTFAGDELRMSRLLVHRSRLAEAEALLVSLGLGESDSDSDADSEGPTRREHFEALLDAVGTPIAEPLDFVWSVGPEPFGDWMAASLPDLLDRLPLDAVLAMLAPLDASGREAHRASLMLALADAPATTRGVVIDALDGGGRPDALSLWAELLAAAAAP